ncbi:MAG: response regulator [Clostridiales Family XIII bacterium]|nr:response regulator [Clostridiales Family XIII bacterium]
MAEDGTNRYVSLFEQVGLESYSIPTMLAYAIESVALKPGGRGLAVEHMKEQLHASSDVVGIWACYEPDAFDGPDEVQASQRPYENHEGRFVPNIYTASESGSITVAHLADFDDPERGAYYQRTKSTQKPSVTGPFLYEAGGADRMFCTIAVPIFRSGLFVGAAGVDISLDALAGMVAADSMLGEGYFFAVTGEGDFIVPPSPAQLLHPYTETWMGMFEQQIEELLDGGSMQQLRVVDPGIGEEVIFTAGSVHFARAETPWIIGSIMPISDVNAPAKSLTLTILAIGVFLILLVSALILFVIRKNLGELPTLTGVAEKLADGDINVRLSRVPADKTANEIDRLKQSFERLIRQTQVQVADVQRVASGDYSFEITPQGEHDLLGIALSQMVGALNEMHQGLTKARHAAEREREKAEKANRAKDIFLAQMSNEMRTPLNAVIGLSELLLEEGNPSSDNLDAEARADIEEIYASGVALLSLVGDILDLARTNSGDLRPISAEYDVPSIINDTMTMNALHIGNKPLDFRLEVDETIPSRLCGDALRIKQVWSNLLDNAFKFTKKGSVVFRVSWKKSTDDESVWLLAEVEDTGIGIRKEELGKIFSETEKVASELKTRYRGTGIGLPLARRLTELMGGTISAESEYGKGSLFRISIRQQRVSSAPIGQQVAEALTHFRHAADKRLRGERIIRPDLSHARVLVVDDVSTNLTIAKGLLKPYRMVIDTARNGQEAVELVRCGVPKYDAIFMDHMMPEMDGVEAVRIIREEIGTDYAASVPIIALTANALEGSKEMFLRSGFQHFLAKPIDVLALDAAVRRWVLGVDNSTESAQTRLSFDAAAPSAPIASLPPSPPAPTNPTIERPTRQTPDSETLSDLLRACMLFDVERMNNALAALDMYRYREGEGLVQWLKAKAAVMSFRAMAERLREELHN